MTSNKQRTANIKLYMLRTPNNMFYELFGRKNIDIYSVLEMHFIKMNWWMEREMTK